MFRYCLRVFTRGELITCVQEKNLRVEHMVLRPFERFANHLLDVTQGNTNLNIESRKKNHIRISYANGAAIVNFEPSANGRGVELAYGRTSLHARKQGYQTRLRTYAVRAARSAGVPLWQYGMNLNNLVFPGQPPISTRIMRSLGAEWTRGIPSGSKGRIERKKWGSLVRGHRYSLRSKK